MDKKASSALEFNRVVSKVKPSRGLIFGLIILGALLAFEIFNYSTTDYALTDLLGDLRFLDLRWATILAIAFCAIDFAGIARLFTPERGVGRAQGGVVSVWRMAAGCHDECHAHLLGRHHRHLEPHIIGWVGALAIDDHQGGASVRRHHGVGDPRADHRFVLGGGRAVVQPIRSPTCPLGTQSKPASAA